MSNDSPQPVFHPRLAIVLHDVVMVWLAWTAVHWVRYAFWPDAPRLALLPGELPVVILVQGVILHATGLYRGIWRFASLPDLWNILKASVLGALGVALALFLLFRLEGVPRSVLVLYPLILTLLLGGPRLAYRVWKDHRLEFHARPNRSVRVLVLGAGRAADLLARDLRAEGIYHPVGFLDDDPQLRGRKLRGLPILGAMDELDRVAREKAVDMAVIAIPSASAEQMRRIVEICERAGVEFRTVPRMQDLVSGRFGSDALKAVAIEDLLGREPVKLDWQAIRAGCAGKAVLVTGGGGSIGAELCRQIAQLSPARLGILERSEYNLYEIERELRHRFPQLVIDAVLGDVCDGPMVERMLARFAPDTVFHAAAYKQVPLLQAHPREAARNNVVGTATVARAAQTFGVPSFVLISTDKAVNPVNVMGASKRAAELYCQLLAVGAARTRFVTVRFGNVLDSAGSVVPLFREQIERGGPVTVTHPEITRFFMTIPEACQLILEASVIGEGGEIYVLDMGAPVRIQYLAEQMIRLAGKRPGEDIAITYTGLRPGEKLFEELFHELESCQPTGHQKILRARHRALEAAPLVQHFAALEEAVREFDEGRVEALLGTLVPDYLRGEEEPRGARVVELRSKRG